MPETLTLRRFADMHCHFRLYGLLDLVLSFTAQYCAYGVAMPNTKPRPILTAKDVIWYRNIIERCVDKIEGNWDWHWGAPFKPVMTIAIRDNTTPKIVEEAHKAGAIAGKVYPLDVTTNSEDGLRDFFNPKIMDTFRAMRDVGMRLLLHGEVAQNRLLVTRREQAFLPTFRMLAEQFPDLFIVLEHISTSEGISAVLEAGPNVAGTITGHHPVLTLNDVIGDGIRPHNMCMPVAKSFEDRDALVCAMTSGIPKFFLGSDTAPHERSSKECAKGACGCFTAPVLPSLLAQIFEQAGHIERLDDFCSKFGPQFYGLPVPEETITLVRRDWVVPKQYGNVVPFMAGETMHYVVA